jgi:hypothetical protein
MSDQYEFRKRLTFEQAEGVEPLPTQLQLRELSDELRAKLWQVFFESLQKSLSNTRGGHIRTRPYFVNPSTHILYDKHIQRDHRMADEFDPECNIQLPGIKSIFVDGDYTECLGKH